MNDHGTYLGKAIRQSHEGNIWLPMDSPYLADLVEAITHHGQTNIQTLKSALESWLLLHGQPHLGAGAVERPSDPVQWSDDEKAAWSAYLHAKPQTEWTPEDWSMMVKWLLQQYWSPKWASNMASWVATKSTILGQIEASLSAQPPSDKLAAAMAAQLPATASGLVELGIPASEITQALIEFARIRCAQAIVDVGDRLRSGIKEAVLEHHKGVLLGGEPTNLTSQLFDRFAAANRDWRRIAVTEVSENAAQGAIAACKPGDQVKRVERYKGVCAWCAKINGKVLTVVSPGKPDKNGETEVWPGKTNIGRSSAPRKIIDGRLYDREPDELWWIAAGAQHPHCFVNGGVPIYTDTGYRPIRDIKVGDMVLTHKGRFRAVNWVLDNPKYEGALIQATVSFDGKNKKVLPLTTPEHPFLTARGWVKAGELVAGDVLMAMAKECPTCNTKFTNLRHSSVVYCGNKCIPKSGVNQFSTADENALKEAKQLTAARNSERMARLTIEQRKELTAAARRKAASTGFAHLKNLSQSVKAKTARSNAAMNYIARPEELQLVDELRVLGVTAQTQFKIQRGWRDAANRTGWWFADIALPEQKIIIEIDGSYWHRDKQRDQKRDDDIRAQGWDVLRVDYMALQSDVKGYAEMVARRAMNHSGDYQFVGVKVERVVVTMAKPRANKLWNFGVDEDESYVAAGVVVHNCRGRWLPFTGVDPAKYDAFMAKVKEKMAQARAEAAA